MRILSIGKTFHHPVLPITSVQESSLAQCEALESYDYIIITGGDGTIRRVLKKLYHRKLLQWPPLILNPKGSFNMVAKMHRVPEISIVLELLANGKIPKTQKHDFYKINDELFLFSAGNMGDLQHIFFSETLRFGFLEKGLSKYILAALFLFPAHLIMTPFMLLSSKRFFIFTPFGFIKKLGSFYGQVNEEIRIDLENEHNMLELDGDIVTIHSRHLHIRQAGFVSIVTR
ncbi:MAG: diacylglycerol kinase family protein [Sulfurovum sp.]|nr:diacylglycerol kinase family protein [Sulfurovum sp.]